MIFPLRGVRLNGQVLDAIGRSHAVIEFAPDGTILSANDIFLRIMGYARDEIMGQHHRRFVPAEERDTEAYREFWRALAAGQPQTREFRRITKAGADVWLGASYDPVLDRAGKVIKVIKIAADRTAERLRANDADAQLDAISRTQGVIAFDPDGTILDCNPVFLDAMGYRRDEVRGRHHRLFIDPAEAAGRAYAAFWDALRRGEAQVAEFRRIAKGGREVWIQASYIPVRDLGGRVYRVIKHAVDVTANKLRSLDFECQVAAIGRSQAVIQFDLDGTILDANPIFLSAMGYRLEEVKGRHHRIFVDPAEAATTEYARFWDRLRQGESLTAEYRRIGKGGREVWIRATYTPIVDLQGRPRKVVKFAIDMTAQKLARRQAADAAVAAEGNVESVAAATQEMVGSITEIAHSMAQSRDMVDEIRARAQTADGATGKLGAASQAMDQVAQFINQLARQITMLSLNATIESARAGEAGKGFAVVANEVKNLATQTSEATRRISDEIAAMQEVSQEVVTALAAINASVGSIQEVVTTVAAAAEQQSVVTRQISANMHAAAEAVAGVSRNLGELTDLNSLAG